MVAKLIDHKVMTAKNIDVVFDAGDKTIMMLCRALSWLRKPVPR
jgi:hypothetical protein